MKRGKVVVLTFLFILAVSTFVIAEGNSDSGSSGSNDSTSSDSINELKNRTNYTKNYNETMRYKERGEIIKGLLRAINASEMRNERAKFVLAKLYECDQIDNRTERIACRLEIHKVARNNSVDDDVENEIKRNETRLPEVCKKLKDREECKKLYRAVNYCYNLNNTKQNNSQEKDKCFKRIAGFIHANIKDEDNLNREEKTRKYLVFLLYELQERIEKKVNNGSLDATTGANLIEQITVIKEDLMSGESKEVIKPKMQQLRRDFKEAMINE